MEQLILHLWGDYILQSGWMANNKTKRWIPAISHATVYSLPFLLIASPLAVLVIWSTHAVIDRFRLARYICWAKDFLAPGGNPHKWNDCKATGYAEFVPCWLSTWLMIIADNTLHLTINYLAIKYL